VRLDDLTLEVRDRTLQRVGQITAPFMQLRAHPRWCSVGEWKITLPGEHPLVPALIEPGSGIILSGPDGTETGVILSGPTLAPARARGPQNPDGTFTFTGVSDDVHLLDAVAVGDPTSEYDEQTAANDTRTGLTEALLRAYVDANIGAGAIASRRVGFRTYVEVEPVDLGRGVSQTKSPRFQNLLELLRELVTYDSSVGFRLVQVGDALQFQVLDARERGDLIRFDIENGTLTSEEAMLAGPSLTRAIVAGRGEGVGRQIVVRANTSGEETSWGRVVERFIDQRNTEIVAELEQSGDEALAEGASGASVKLIPADDTTMRYGFDWRPGDFVTAVVAGVEEPNAVTEAVIVADADGVRVGAALGDVSAFKRQDALAQKVDAIDSRVGRLERFDILPARLSLKGKQVTNWDDVTEPGFYWSAVGAANAPVPQPMEGVVRVYGGDDVYAGRMIQELRSPGIPGAFRLHRGSYVRMWEGSVWGPWVQTASLSGLVTFNGSGGSIRGSVAVSFPQHFFVNPPVVVVGNATNAGGAIIAGEGLSATVTGFTAVAVANTGAAFTGTYVLKWSAQEQF
jgi:hypothetical protein